MIYGCIALCQHAVELIYGRIALSQGTIEVCHGISGVCMAPLQIENPCIKVLYPLVPLVTGLLQKCFALLCVRQLQAQCKNFSLPLQARAQLREGASREVLSLRIGCQRQQCIRLVCAHQQYAQTIAVVKTEGRVSGRKLIPQAKHAEICAVHISVMEKHNRSAGQFRQPTLKVVSYGFISVQTVDVQQIYAAIGKMGQRFVERHAQQTRKAAVQRIVHRTQIVVDGVVVSSGVGVALPGVHGPCPCGQLLRNNGLTKCHVGNARIRAQLDKGAGLLHGQQPRSKWNVARPRRRVGQVTGFDERGGGKCKHRGS